MSKNEILRFKIIFKSDPLELTKEIIFNFNFEDE